MEIMYVLFVIKKIQLTRHFLRNNIFLSVQVFIFSELNQARFLLWTGGMKFRFNGLRSRTGIFG